ncbi:uncharacterized protein LAESUDRAFT_728261 [Laetiporus sulphureus 93-53]|uniref:Uncharacterized protein n=1 Tax=Laetiporus sulphureus 93-53 TaxID=1314785 RepID=A0A165D9S0_9APHY|nr:uncharacterized protein LAESUDRAFT_728261 [Laetiporus sulphureus 93-53]KZT04397.1 hypothetical protein LAESUDRAFT_728261 [Laetiporus sulphureus 93-53]
MSARAFFGQLALHTLQPVQRLLGRLQSININPVPHDTRHRMALEDRRRGKSGGNSPVGTAGVVSFLAVIESLIDPLSDWKLARGGGQGRRRGEPAIGSPLRVATSGAVRPLTIVALPFGRRPAVGVDGLRVLRALPRDPGLLLPPVFCTSLQG